MTSRTDSRIRSTPSPARNASSSSDATDWDNAIGGNLPGEYLPVHTENPADAPLTQAGSPTTRNPTTPGDSHSRSASYGQHSRNQSDADHRSGALLASDVLARSASPSIARSSRYWLAVFVASPARVATR